MIQPNSTKEEEKKGSKNEHDSNLFWLSRSSGTRLSLFG